MPYGVAWLALVALQWLLATAKNTEVSVTTQQRMAWWQPGAVLEGVPRSPDKGDRFLLFDYDNGGLNNIRIGWEMAAIAAAESSRTLVYPPSQGLYLVYGEASGFEYFLNMDRLHAGLNAIPLSKFLQLQPEDTVPRILRRWADVREQVGLKHDGEFPARAWKGFRNVNFVAAGHNAETVCDMQTYRSDAKVLYQDPKISGRIFNCGNWPNVGEPRFADKFPHAWHTPDWSFKLLRNGFVWHSDAFDIAGRVVEHLGLFNYVSLHARYGDFQFQDGRGPEQTLLKNGWLSKNGLSFLQASSGGSCWESIPPSVQMEGGVFAQSWSFFQMLSNSKARSHALARERGRHATGFVRRWLEGDKKRSLYVATDVRSPEYLEPFREAGIKAIRWEDLMRDAKEGHGPLADVIHQYTPQRLANFAGIVETLICTYGKVFIGSEKSTFTGSIERMRLYAGAPTHATYIRYNGMHASDKGERLLHADSIDSEVEAKIAAEVEAWDKRGGTLDRNNIGRLPQPRKMFPF